MKSNASTESSSAVSGSGSIRSSPGRGSKSLPPIVIRLPMTAAARWESRTISRDMITQPPVLFAPEFSLYVCISTHFRRKTNANSGAMRNKRGMKFFVVTVAPCSRDHYTERAVFLILSDRFFAYLSCQVYHILGVLSIVFATLLPRFVNNQLTPAKSYNCRHHFYHIGRGFFS